jgi:hypothetical protein
MLARQTDDLRYQYLAVHLILVVISAFPWSIDDFLESRAIQLFMNLLSHPNWEIQRIAFRILAHFHSTIKGCQLSVQERVFSELATIFRCLIEEPTDRTEALEILSSISKAFRFLSRFSDILPDEVPRKILFLYSEALEARPWHVLNEALLVTDILVRKSPDKHVTDFLDSGMLHVLLDLVERSGSKDLLAILCILCLILHVSELNSRERILAQLDPCFFLHLFIRSTDSEVARVVVKILQNISCLKKTFEWIFNKNVFWKLRNIMENGSYNDKICICELVFSAMAWGSVSVIRAILGTQLPFLALDGVGSDQPSQSIMNCMYAIDRAIGVIMKMGMEDYGLFNEFCEQCTGVLLRLADCGGEVGEMVNAVLERRFPEVYYSASRFG